MDERTDRSRVDPLIAVLLATAGLLAALCVYQGAAYLDTSRVARLTLAHLSAVKDAKPADVPKLVARDKATAGDLKKKNLFIPPETPRNPVTEVAGILGSEALINGQWYKAGAKVGDAKNPATVVSVEPTKVRVSWDGKVTEFLPINAVGQASSGRSSGPGGPGPGSTIEVRRGASSPAPTPPAGAVRVGGSSRGGMSSDEMRALQDKMRNASSPEERQQIMKEINQRMSGQ